MTQVVVAIGSNVVPHAHVRKALDLLEATFDRLQRSPIYRCGPVGVDGGDFLNLVAVFDTDRALEPMRALLRDIEATCGRDRRRPATAGCMDIDLLLFGDAVRDAAPRLPRADILEHAFVLRPLADLLPDARHPVCGRTYAEIWAQFRRPSPVLEAVSLDANSHSYTAARPKAGQ